MSDFIDLCSVGEIPSNRPIARKIGDRTIVLCRTASGVHALDGVCPHRGGPLGQGDLLGEELVCPWHLWTFDVRTGLCPGSAEMGVAAHDVKVEGDRVLVRLAPPRTPPELL